MAAALATFDDVAERLGRDFTDSELIRIPALLRDASAAFRRAAGGQIISADTTTVRLRRGGPTVRLAQWPVNTVTAVVGLDAVAIGFDWYGGSTFELGAYLSTAFDVTYTHGYTPVPDEAIGVVCQMVGRALGTMPDSAGVTQETLGAYSASYGTAAASGAFGMLEAERVIARSFRRPQAPISML